MIKNMKNVKREEIIIYYYSLAVKIERNSAKVSKEEERRKKKNNKRKMKKKLWLRERKRGRKLQLLAYRMHIATKETFHGHSFGS